MSRPNVRGFTVTELLVTIGVIGLLMALLIPAVMAARESARRAQCTSNLAQFGRAMHNFAATRGRFPPALPMEPNKAATRQYAPHVLLLPYVEQGPLHDRIDLTKGTMAPYAPPYGKEAETVLPVYLCPSDPTGFGNNYRVCTGPTAYGVPVAGPGEEPAGAFLVDEGLSAAEFGDGLSNTAAASEKRKSDLDPGRFDRAADMWFTSVEATGTYPATADVVRLCGSLAGEPTAYHPHAGWTWFVPGYHHTWYNHAVAPNAPVADCAISKPSIGEFPFGGVFRASSDHRGGVNVLMMDGAVRFVADGVDLALWRAISTRSGGEAVGAF